MKKEKTLHSFFSLMVIKGNQNGFYQLKKKIAQQKLIEKLLQSYRNLERHQFVRTIDNNEHFISASNHENDSALTPDGFTLLTLGVSTPLTCGISTSLSPDDTSLLRRVCSPFYPDKISLPLLATPGVDVLFVCLYRSINTCVNVYIFIYAYTNIHTYTYIFTYIHMYFKSMYVSTFK